MPRLAWYSLIPRAAVTITLAATVTLSLACSPSPARPSGHGLALAPSQPRGQQLPITAVVELGGQAISLEVAQTPEQQALGLMYRPTLAPDRGMLFPIAPPRPVSFWMKNVPVPLDMVFIYQGRIQALASQVPPCEVDPCPTYGPQGQLVDQVIELAAGRAAELGLQVGDAVAVRFLDDASIPLIRQ
ncbi:MAG: DUF192 domain-containing protein [Cyanobacteriota bacterium]|nr:DUF192 domain-containing protein [Cyanobacteriota bacterium]